MVYWYSWYVTVIGIGSSLFDYCSLAAAASFRKVRCVGNCFDTFRRSNERQVPSSSANKLVTDGCDIVRTVTDSSNSRIVYSYYSAISVNAVSASSAAWKYCFAVYLRQVALTLVAIFVDEYDYDARVGARAEHVACLCGDL